LMHPGAMPWGAVHHKARMLDEPCSATLPLRGPAMGAEARRRLDGCGHRRL
jgi:hypothetical protein